MLHRLSYLCLAIALVLPAGVRALTPSDPEFDRQWYLRKMGVPAAWEFTQGGEVVVAVLDTGVDVNHPDLAGNIWTNTREIPGNAIDDDQNGYIDDVRGWNFVEQSNDPSPQFSPGWTEAGVTHGTVIAGIIGAVGNNLSGVAGLNWKVKIMPLRILDSQGIGDSAAAAAAIDYAVRNGARVLNFSFVTDEQNIGLEEAIHRAARAGVLVVAAAGNNRTVSGDNLDSTPMYPICSDPPGQNLILGVSATDEQDKKSDFSNYGSRCVDLSAPGSNILSTQVYNPSLAAFNSFTRGGWNGTSVASPMVTGAAALMLAANPGLSRESLMQILMSTADPLDAGNATYRGQLGSGRVNVERAVRTALGLPVALPAPTPPPPPPTNRIAYVAVAAASGAAPEVRVYSTDGVELAKFMAYHPNFRGGVRVAAGDVDGDGIAEIVTGAGPGGGPHVRIFDYKGKVKSQFFAYHPNFRGGVSVAVADVDGDGIAEIVTGAGPGGGPHVRVFDFKGGVQGQFFAYEPTATMGVNVAVGDIDGDGQGEIVAAPASRAGSQPVKYFSSRFAFLGTISFLTPSATGGVSVAVADVVGDSNGDIVLARTIASDKVTVVTSGVTPRPAITVGSVTGVSLSTLDVNSDGRADILVAPAAASGKLRLIDAAGKTVNGFTVSSAFPTGATVAGFSTGLLR